MSSSELTNEHGDQSAAPLDVLRQFARKREMRPPAEQCELCSVEIAAVHRHPLDLSRRRLVCVCHPCSILFGGPGGGSGKYRLFAPRLLSISEFSNVGEPRGVFVIIVCIALN